MHGRVVVVGVGNPWRGDDGVGPAVAGMVRACAAASVDVVDVVDVDGEMDRLMDAWDGADVAIVVDAVRTGARPGTVHRIYTDGLAAVQSASSHGLGVRQAVAMGRALDRLPRRVVLVGVEGSSFVVGSALSAEVAAAVEPAARLVARLLADAAA